MVQDKVSVFIGEPTSIDPSLGSEHDGALILRFLCDPLIDFIPGNGEPRPAAAQNWEIKDGGKTIHFYLQKGMKFHHGREVTAEDYVYSWNRFVSPKQNSELAYHLGIIEGFNEVRQGKAETLSGLYCLGDHELLVHLKEPFHEIHAVFGHHALAPVPKELVEQDPDWFKDMPVSNGPYRLAEPWVHHKMIALERFNDYYAGNSAFVNGGAGYINKIAFRIYSDLDDAYDDWCNGELDITKVPPVRMSEAKQWGRSFRQTPCALIKYLGFPNDCAPFNNPNVRKAIAMGLDREKIISEVFEDTRSAATGVLPPSIGSSFQVNASNLLSQSADPKRARRILDKEGVPSELTVPFYYNEGLGHEVWVQKVREQLFDHLGIRLDMRPLGWAEFLNTLQVGIDGMFRMTWAIDSPSPDNILYPLFCSESIGMDNFSLYQNIEFDKKLKKARATSDRLERESVYREAEKIILDDMPIIPLWFGVQSHVINLNSLNFYGNRIVDIFGEPVLRNAYFVNANKKVSHS